MSASQLKLTYFNHAGRGELMRLLLVFANIEFVDNHIELEDFPVLKPTLPLGQLPVLEVNGTTYVQSMAMARYAAKLSGVYPQDPLDALCVGMISDTLLGLMNTFVAIVYGEKDEVVKAEKTKQFVSEGAPSTRSPGTRQVLHGRHALVRRRTSVRHCDEQLEAALRGALDRRVPEARSRDGERQG